MSDRTTEIVPNPFQTATPVVEPRFEFNAKTIADLGGIPLAMAFERQIKDLAAEVRAKRADVAAKNAAWTTARVATTDPGFATRVALARKAIESVRRALLAAAADSAVKVAKVDVKVADLRVNDETGMRTATVHALVPHVGESFADADDVEAAKLTARVAGLGATINMVVTVPFTEDQLRLRGEAEAAEKELAEAEAAFQELAREKEEALARHKRFADYKYAQIAAQGIPGMQDVVEKTYDASYAANVLGGLKRFDAGQLAASGLVPAAAAMPPAIDAPAPKAAKKK